MDKHGDRTVGGLVEDAFQGASGGFGVHPSAAATSFLEPGHGSGLVLLGHRVLPNFGRGCYKGGNCIGI